MTTSTTHQNPIAANAVFLYCSIGRLRTRKKLNVSAVDTHDISPELLKLTKSTLQSPELKTLAEHDAAILTWIRARSLPSPFSGKGISLLPVRLIEPVMAKIDEAQAIRLTLIDSFMQSYDRCKQEASVALGSAFDERDYPSPDEVRKTFYFEVQMWELQAPGQKLKAISKDLYERELLKINSMWTEASATVTGVLMTELKKLTSHIQDRLQPGIDGKPKIFRDTVVTNLTSWLELFAARNVTNDEELVALVEKARGLVQGLDPENIRDNESLRKEVADGFAGLTDMIDTAIINAPIRSIDLDEEAV